MKEGLADERKRTGLQSAKKENSRKHVSGDEQEAAEPDQTSYHSSIAKVRLAGPVAQVVRALC